MVRREEGWTFIELLICCAIIGAIAVMAPQIITISTKYLIFGKAKVELQREARAAMYIIERQLREAQSATITINQAANQPYYSQLQFTKVQGTVVTLTQNNNILTLTEGTNVSTLSTNLAYVAFTFPHSDDMTIISVALTLQQEIYGGAFKALHMASEQIRVMN